MNKAKLAIFGGLFFTYIIIQKASDFGMSYLAIDYIVLFLMLCTYIYHKIGWLFQTKK